MTTAQNKIRWTLDPSHSAIDFRIKHLMITNVKGSFKKFEGTVNAEGNNFKNAEISFSCDASSIDTRDEKRDAHLKGEEFFNTEKFSKITFEGKNYPKGADEKTFELRGDLTIKGISKPVSLDVQFEGMSKDPWGNEKAGFVISGKISRKDWGLTWNTNLESGGVLVGDEVKISCEVELLKDKKMEAPGAAEASSKKEAAA